MTTPAPVKEQKAAPPPQPFRVGVYSTEGDDYDNEKVMGAGTVNFPQYVVTPNGWLRGLWFLIEGNTAGNIAAAAFTDDAPFNAIEKITFLDVGNREIFGPLSGYDWAVIQKHGGYHGLGDPRADQSFSTVTGTGATGGSFSMVMYLPLEAVARDALGDVENKSSSSTYKVALTLAGSGTVYATAPTNPPTVRIRATADGYTEPEAADAMGRPLSQAPPAAGTVQYWTTEDDALNAGSAKYLLTNGLGYSIRNIIFKLVDNAGSRATGDADWPDPVTLTFGKVQLFQRYRALWISRMGRAFRLDNLTPDEAGGRELGVFPVWFDQDFGLDPGAELRNGYLVTKPGNVLQWSGSIGGAGTHTLYTLVNYIIPPGNDAGKLRASR